VGGFSKKQSEFRLAAGQQIFMAFLLSQKQMCADISVARATLNTRERAQVSRGLR
jgi:hypothetical protein